VALSGNTPGAVYPLDIDFRYDWVVLNLTGTVQTILTGNVPPTYLNNVSFNVNDGTTNASLGSSYTLLAANPGTPQTSAVVALTTAFRVSALTPNVNPYLMLSALSEGFVESTQNFYFISGTVMQFKETV